MESVTDEGTKGGLVAGDKNMEKITSSGGNCAHPEHDKPRCDIHGTALERLNVATPMARVTSYHCPICGLEATDA